MPIHFLREYKSAPLYHGTDYHSAYLILQTNMLKANTSNETETHGVSFTRNKNEWYYKFVFVVDQAKLANNHKVAPVYRHGIAGRDLAEERVPYDIRNLNKLLIEVDVRGDTNLRIIRKKLLKMTPENLVTLPSNSILQSYHYLYLAIKLAIKNRIKLGKNLLKVKAMYEEILSAKFN
ncbi:hypothetical protein SP15_243 [Bacillus phage SP-15]|uniref:Uncharacterized protein n=1 Tax=Bacillus phage SP-15 TaxID=1792032 RepID=A0A127AWL2_9CAUD|nr:hypothetical protein SP15_243 [Bacillus phage SP-15]AMM45048.1 hypothetical protein SP15_243 [Bacillus phage SP-15]